MLYLGADHAGFSLKEKVKQYLEKKGLEYEDMGNFKKEKRDDYPKYGVKVARKVAGTQNNGILMCGSGQGVAIAANKVKGIRAVYVSTVKEAKLTREHNDANVLCLSGWNTSLEKAKMIIDAWLQASFSSAKRHHRRVNQIKAIERKWK